MAQENPDSDFFSTSQFYMWRCVTAMAHADGMVQAEERAYLEKIFNNMKERAYLGAEQFSVLIGDLEKPQDPGDMLRHINDPKFRGQVIYFARLLAYKDGHLHPSEEELLDKLHASVVEGLDFEEIKKQVHDNVQQELTLHDIEVDDNRPESGLFGLVNQFMLFFGYDALRD